MFCVGLEPTITASERAKTVHALDRSAIVIGHVKVHDFFKNGSFLLLEI
jgi:hypothetical protein